MGLFGSKEEKAKRLLAQREYSGAEQEKAEALKEKILASCLWLNEKTAAFRAELQELGIAPQSGFELERTVAGEKDAAFAVNPLLGLAFDNEAEKAVVFMGGDHVPETPEARETETYYTFHILSFCDIESVAVDIGANPMYRSGPFKTNANIGSAKAIEQVSFRITTRDPALPLLHFVITKIQGQSARHNLTEEAMSDTTISVFSGTEDLYRCTDRNAKKKNMPIPDYAIERVTSLPEVIGEERLYNVNYREKLNHLEIIINRLYYAAMEAEAIIRRNDLSGKWPKPWELAGDPALIENEKSKLLEMKESGFLSKEEFSMLLGQLL